MSCSKQHAHGKPDSTSLLTFQLHLLTLMSPASLWHWRERLLHNRWDFYVRLQDMGAQWCVTPCCEPSGTHVCYAECCLRGYCMIWWLWRNMAFISNLRNDMESASPFRRHEPVSIAAALIAVGPVHCWAPNVPVQVDRSPHNFLLPHCPELSQGPPSVVKTCIIAWPRNLWVVSIADGVLLLIHDILNHDRYARLKDLRPKYSPMFLKRAAAQWPNDSNGLRRWKASNLLRY